MRSIDPRFVTLVGPGGAGKMTIGTLVAERLQIGFVDLDRRFADCAGDFSAYITRFGYDRYARENVRLYRSLWTNAPVAVLRRCCLDS